LKFHLVADSEDMRRVATLYNTDARLGEREKIVGNAEKLQKNTLADRFWEAALFIIRFNW
jgi:hypothetical protein